MSEPIEPLHHKMTEAMPKAVEHEEPNPSVPGHNPKTPVAQPHNHNIADPHATPKEHMVDIGRGEQTRGRQGQ